MVGEMDEWREGKSEGEREDERDRGRVVLSEEEMDREIGGGREGERREGAREGGREGEEWWKGRRDVVMIETQIPLACTGYTLFVKMSV